MKAILRLSLLFSALVALAAAPVHAQSTPAGVTPDMIKKGDAIYHGTGLCFACHGPDAKGAVGPDLTDQVWIHSKGTYDEIVTSIMTGVPQEKITLGKGPMPPKGGSSISDDDVKAVAAYVWSLSHTGGK